MTAMNKDKDALPVRRVVCPNCGGPSVYAPSNPFRPFCSERCKNLDLGAWASEDFRLPADTPPDDDGQGGPKSSDPKLQ
ncbi:MAG: DNA gyrase inhibitor YacG [Burkholderiales bacterium RIFCSPHIGHO2_12_FULL_61_11]|nr:MAG: DNA gyrase inhibitor YacG [Burkholderiales bacterium RIFCSPHIGHO2_12_FULL_61_11]